MISIQTLLDRLRAQVAVQLDTLKVSGPSYFARRTKQVGSLRTRKGRQMLWRSALPLLTYAVAFVIAQYAGAALAFAVSPKLEGATPLYLQGAITVSALLLTPPRRWWLYLLLTLPLMFIDAWLLSLAPSAALMRVLLFVYIILVCIAVLTVSLLRRCVTLPLRFASVGEISRFVACVAVGAVPAAFIATVLRSVLLSWDVWLSWQSGFFGYVLGIVVFTPAIVLWLTNGPGGLGLTSRGRRVEIALLSLATVTVSVFVFTTHLPDDTVVSALSYLLVPVLLWAAVRFSPLVVASALAISTTIAIIGAVNNGGPFVFSSTTANVLALQLYLVFIGVPFYFLAALVQERKQVDGALQASEARYRGVVESQTELISRSLPDTTLTFVNEAHARHLGKSPAELLGRRWIELVPDAERERVQNHIQSLLEQPGVATIEHAVTLPDGSLGWQQWVNRSLGDAVGRVIELQSVGRDVTERKRLEQEREEARAQAERQAEELARVFETVTDGVAVYDQRGQEVRTNAALHRLLGLDMAPPEYAQMSLHERMALFAARDERGRPLAQNEGPLPRALAGVAGAEAMDMRSRTLDGREIELNIRAAPLRSRTGELEGVVCVFRDQTEQKQLERERAAEAEQLDRVFEGMADGVFVYDTQGRVMRTNAAARRLLGLDSAPPDFHHLPWNERLALCRPRDAGDGHLLTPEEWLATRALRGDLLGAAEARDIWMRTLDGRELEVSASVAPLRDHEGQLVGAVLLLGDRTGQRRLERERKAARLGEQEAQLRAEAALDANQRLEQFLATASHDLRTPVTVALFRVQLAQRRFSQLAPAATDSHAAALGESLTKADQALHRLKQQVARLFDLAQLQTGQLELVSKPLDLVALVQDTVAAQRVASPGRSIRLRLPKNPSARVRGDADRLDQVLSNYLTNAVKYSPPDRPITVQLQVERGGWARVTVQDRGPGIPPEQQAHVWELVHRMPGSAGQRGSLGLGLYLCKTLVERHGGEVGLESEMGQGATFQFRLPLTSSADVPTP